MLLASSPGSKVVVDRGKYESMCHFPSSKYCLSQAGNVLHDIKRFYMGETKYCGKAAHSRISCFLPRTVKLNHFNDQRL